MDAGRAMDAAHPRDARPIPRDGRIRLRDGGSRERDTGTMGTDADGGMGPIEPTEVSFVAMGDQGEGNVAQHEVGAQVAAVCELEGCDFVVLLGDNFYESGVTSVEDEQWRTKFEDPYNSILVPFHPVLGNHDYGGVLFGFRQGGLGNEFDRGPIEVEYSAHSPRWTMPDTHYTVRYGNVGLVALDTNSILWDDTTNGDQWPWFSDAVADLRADGAEWIIVAGHHPYRSNGRHGNAGSYESIEVGGIEVENPVPILNGGNVRDFFEDVVCGEADVVLAGHDHNRQWLDEPDALCGAELIVSGAGAKTTGFESEANDVEFADDSTEGFLYVRITGDEMYGRFVNRDGTTAFERVVMRPSAMP
jgi:tartrate-resistant acid phosphatase type 5